MLIAVVFFAGVAFGVVLGLILSAWAERRVRRDAAKAAVIGEAEQVLRDAQ